MFGAKARRDRSYRAVGALAACLVLGLSLSTAGTSVAAAARPASSKPTMHVLIMGDSYSAGNGAGDYYGPTGCRRSYRNYGKLFAAALGKKPYDQPAVADSTACSGATTQDFYSPQGRDPRQLNAVNSSYDLIFLTIGGNDANFKYIVKYCLVQPFRGGQTCDDRLSAAEALVRNGTIQRRITGVLKSIYAKANPAAKIVLLGYPYLEGDQKYVLIAGSGKHKRTIEVGKRLHELNDDANRIDANAVAALNRQDAGSPFAFVSVQQLFDGPPYHGLYANKENPHRWLVEPSIDGLAENDIWYHPNPTGWSQEAQLLLRSNAVPKTPKPVIVTSLPTGTVGKSYSGALTTVDHRRATWSLAGGSLPPGLSLSGYTVRGNPTVAGTYHFKARVVDATGRTAVATISLRIRPAAAPPPVAHTFYNNYSPATQGVPMCRGNPGNPQSDPGGTLAESFTADVAGSISSATVDIDPDSTVTANATLSINGANVASDSQAAAGDTSFDFGSVDVAAGDQVTLSITFSASSGKIITIYETGNPGGQLAVQNSCPAGAPTFTTSSTGLRATISGTTI